jgi:hypothetical protein
VSAPAPAPVHLSAPAPAPVRDRGMQSRMAKGPKRGEKGFTYRRTV